jgi:hypothetical protein
MARRNSFLAPPKKSITAHTRRRSADDRSDPSLFTPTSSSTVRGETLGRSWSRPLSISSTEEGDKNDEDYDDDDSDCAITGAHTPTRTGHRSLPDSKTKKASRSRPPATPANTRPAPRQAATAPETRRKPDLDEFPEESSPSRQTFPPPCGYKPYVKRGSYEKHIRNCGSCQTELRNPITENATSTQDEGSPIRKTGSGGKVNNNASMLRGANSRKGEEPEDSAQKTKQFRGVLERTERGQFKDNDTNEAPPKLRSAKAIHFSLITEICRDLSAKEEKGWVYLMRSPKKNQEGLVKVGFTKDLKKRQEALNSRCKLEVEIIQTWGPIQFIERIEKLVKVDLKYLCVPWSCRCGTKHKEWFRIDEDFAEKMVNVWVSWMEQEPYVGKQLTPLWNHLITESRKPVPMFKHHDHEARHTHWSMALGQPTQEENELFGKKKNTTVSRSKKPVDDSQEIVSWSDIVNAVKTFGWINPSDQKAQAPATIIINMNNCTITTKKVVKHE